MSDTRLRFGGGGWGGFNLSDYLCYKVINTTICELNGGKLKIGQKNASKSKQMGSTSYSFTHNITKMINVIVTTKLAQ